MTCLTCLGLQNFITLPFALCLSKGTELLLWVLVLDSVRTSIRWTSSVNRSCTNHLSLFPFNKPGKYLTVVLQLF